MKKIYTLIGLTLFIFGCQVEEPDASYETLEGVSGKYKYHKRDKCDPDLEGLESSLPKTINFCTTDQGPDAYLNISIDGDILTGDYGSWCIDDDLGIALNTCYDNVSVFLSTGTFPEDAFEYPDNFDLVNWLLNKDVVGAENPNTGELFTYGDLQYAIWVLLDDLRAEDCLDCGLGEWSADRAALLVQAAQRKGDGFLPKCGDFVGIILQPDGVQPLVLPFKLSEEDDDDDNCDRKYKNKRKKCHYKSKKSRYCKNHKGYKKKRLKGKGYKKKRYKRKGH